MLSQMVVFHLLLWLSGLIPVVTQNMVEEGRLVVGVCANFSTWQLKVWTESKHSIFMILPKYPWGHIYVTSTFMMQCSFKKRSRVYHLVHYDPFEFLNGHINARLCIGYCVYIISGKLYNSPWGKCCDTLHERKLNFIEVKYLVFKCHSHD